MRVENCIGTISVVVFLLAAGCSKKEEPAPAASNVSAASDSAAADMKKASDSAADAAQKAANDLGAQAAGVQKAADAAAADAQAQAAAARKAADTAAADLQGQGAAITSKAQAAIDNASKLIAESKWSEALQALNQLATMKLTPEQQAMVDKLKAEAQKLAQQGVASQATEKASKAVGGFLQKK